MYRQIEISQFKLRY